MREGHFYTGVSTLLEILAAPFPEALIWASIGEVSTLLEILDILLSLAEVFAEERFNPS